MSTKTGERQTTEDVYEVVPQRLRNKAKPELAEPQCPAVERAHPSVARLKPDALGSLGIAVSSGYTLTKQRCLTKTFKGVSGEPKLR